MKRFLSIITNKFLIVSVAFLLLMLFFDQHDWFTQRESARELDKMNENIEYLQGEVKRMQTELSELDKPEKLEQYAREKYHEKKGGRRCVPDYARYRSSTYSVVFTKNL